ncbi:PP2C family protein-serine/threonine phosphatase [Paenibacillus arenosi]|uniref:Serine/threonine-protein phosphatase n=1 Tax=Paenibacillus arenosi TaxID=2774142 RepID=A0ABR9AY45_9BACL|nr:PP2C family serine/threonine-protein phosphatase [Paenibacillus arenosi]MBD8498806.1 serine/threonine-protein phosphatase [Paenibacillus arenosi]
MSDMNGVPYLILAGLAVLLIGLLIAKRRMEAEEDTSDVRIGNGQTIGARDEQDDYFSSVTTPIGTAAVLADGMSGLENGRLASTIAVNTFIREFLKLDHPNMLEQFFPKAARMSNSEIVRNLKGQRGGTTLVAAVIADEQLYWGAVGDSIIAIFRNKEWIEINEKHTLESVLKERYLRREIAKEDVVDHPMRKRLVNFLGFERFKHMEVCGAPIWLQPGDKIVLCSDGITNCLTELELENILSQPLSPHEAAQHIIEVVEQRNKPNQDNATIIILEHR